MWDEKQSTPIEDLEAMLTLEQILDWLRRFCHEGVQICGNSHASSETWEVSVCSAMEAAPTLEEAATNLYDKLRASDASGC